MSDSFNCPRVNVWPCVHCIEAKNKSVCARHNGVRVRSGTRFESKDEKGNETSLHGRSRRSDVSSGGEARVYSGHGVVSRI